MTSRTAIIPDGSRIIPDGGGMTKLQQLPATFVDSVKPDHQHHVSILMDDLQVEHSVDDSFSGSDISGHQGTPRRFVTMSKHRFFYQPKLYWSFYIHRIKAFVAIN